MLESEHSYFRLITEVTYQSLSWKEEGIFLNEVKTIKESGGLLLDMAYLQKSFHIFSSYKCTVYVYGIQEDIIYVKSLLNFCAHAYYTVDTTFLLNTNI